MEVEKIKDGAILLSFFVERVTDYLSGDVCAFLGL